MMAKRLDMQNKSPIDKMDLNSICADCAHYDYENETCPHPQGKLKGIRLNESLATAHHDCGVFDEATWVLTPKALFELALEDAKIKTSEKKLALAWEKFEASLEKHGYLKKGE